MAKDYHGFKLADIQRGQAWQEKRTTFGRRLVHVMAVADGYVMHRQKGCSPGLTFWKDFVLNNTRSPGFDSRAHSRSKS